jgi:hypothetical protein
MSDVLYLATLLNPCSHSWLVSFHTLFTRRILFASLCDAVSTMSALSVMSTGGGTRLLRPVNLQSTRAQLQLWKAIPAALYVFSSVENGMTRFWLSETLRRTERPAYSSGKCLTSLARCLKGGLFVDLKLYLNGCGLLL